MNDLDTAISNDGWYKFDWASDMHIYHGLTEPIRQNKGTDIVRVE